MEIVLFKFIENTEEINFLDNLFKGLKEFSSKNTISYDSSISLSKVPETIITSGKFNYLMKYVLPGRLSLYVDNNTVHVSNIASIRINTETSKLLRTSKFLHYNISFDSLTNNFILTITI